MKRGLTRGCPLQNLPEMGLIGVHNGQWVLLATVHFKSQTLIKAVVQDTDATNPPETGPMPQETAGFWMLLFSVHCKS
jgi:hypothetical protein